MSKITGSENVLRDNLTITISPQTSKDLARVPPVFLNPYQEPTYEEDVTMCAYNSMLPHLPGWVF